MQEDTTDHGNHAEDTTDLLIGEQGRNHIQKILSTSTAPKKAITGLQSNYGMKSTHKVQPIFELTDLLDFRRNQLYAGMMVHMRDFFLKYLEKNTELSNEEVEKLLEQVFPYIAFEELRPIANTILTKMGTIPPRFLAQLKPDLIFKDLPVHVKRQVWQSDKEFLGATIVSLIDEYIKHDKRSIDVVSDHVTDPKKRREANPAIKRTVEVIGSSVMLYNAVREKTRALIDNFKQSNSQQFLSTCNFRLETLMSVNDTQSLKISHIDTCHYLCLWVDAWIRSVQNQLLTLTGSLTTQEMVQEFSVTRKQVSAVPPPSAASTNKKKKKPTQPTSKPKPLEHQGDSMNDFTFSNKGRQLMDIRRIKELEAHFDQVQQQILDEDTLVDDIDESLWGDLSAILSGTSVQSTVLQQLYYLIELTSSISTSAHNILQKQEQQAPQSLSFDPAAVSGTMNGFISLLNHPPKYKKGKIKNMPVRGTHTTIINKKVKVKPVDSTGSQTGPTTIKISIKGGAAPTAPTVSSSNTPSPSALLLHGGDDQPGLDGDIEMQEHMMSALTKLYFSEQIAMNKQWTDISQIEGGYYLVYMFYKWLQNMASCRIPLPVDIEEESGNMSTSPVSPPPIPDKVDASALMTICSKNSLARELTLFFLLRQLQNIRIILSRPRHIQNFPSEASDVDMTSNHHHHQHQHHQLTQSSDDDQKLFENCTKLELLLSHLFFNDDNSLTEFAKLVLIGKESWFIHTLVQETSRLIANINNLSQRRYHQDISHILQIVFKLLASKQVQWVPVAQCIAQLASLSYTDLAKKCLLQLQDTVAFTADASKNPQLEELFEQITKIIHEQEQDQMSPGHKKSSPQTPKGASPQGYNYYSSHISPGRKSPPGYHHYQSPQSHHGYHPYMNQPAYHTGGRNPYQHSMHGFGNMPPQQSPTGTTPHQHNPYVTNPYSSAVQQMYGGYSGGYYPQHSPQQSPKQQYPSPQSSPQQSPQQSPQPRTEEKPSDKMEE